MKRGEFIALSASTMMLTALGIDIMLPAFDALREDFNLDPHSTETAKIISFFFLGQVAQIIFGTLSDRFGRLPIFRIGFPLYIIGGIAAAFAPDLSLMLVSRFIAGVGASAVFMTTIAGVRDRFVGNKMAQIMSLIFTIFLFTPVIAPFLGSAILHFSSWRMVLWLGPAVVPYEYDRERREVTFGEARFTIGEITAQRLKLYQAVPAATGMGYVVYLFRR